MRSNVIKDDHLLPRTLKMAIVQSSNPVPLVGYVDRLSVQPGEVIKFMISSDFLSYRAQVVKLAGVDTEKGTLPPLEKIVESKLTGEYKGRKQVYRHGSYAIIPVNSGLLPSLNSFSIECWIYPTTPHKGMQGIVTGISGEGLAGIGLFIGVTGDVGIKLRDGSGKTEFVGSGKSLRSHEWYYVAASFDASRSIASIYQLPLRLFPDDPSSATVEKVVKLGKVDLTGTSILIGASCGEEKDVSQGPVCLFNGKIENPRIFSSALDPQTMIHLSEGKSALKEYGLDLVADWDFSVGIGSQEIVDKSQYALHGKLVNYPKRAVTSHLWTGGDLDFKHCPQEYSAVYFHDDDLDNCEWDVDFEFHIPEKFESGVYAAKLEASGYAQYVPFFVRPKRGEANTKIAFLVPTLSYLAYGDEHIQSDPIQHATVDFPDFEYPTRPMEKYLTQNRLHSLYDVHSDGSGVCFSSRLRPVLTISPEYRSAILGGGKGAPHQFSADLLIISWLHAKGFEFDVITDEDLHWEGASVLRKYKTVVSGSHHEYWSSQMLDALETYLNEGGRFMYMGGNGFYWVTAIDPRNRYVIEIRRWGGTQTWRSEPGEYYLSTTGEMGGLWRNRGRAPQKYVGVGFCAEGFDVNLPYKRVEGSFDPRAAFIFEGIKKDEIIGDFDSLIQHYGAAGYEVDRMDATLGTSPSTILLATASGFSDGYQHVVEENDQTLPKQGGSTDPMVRADMVYCIYPKEGAVFSTASISWAGCLFYNKYDNNVSKITENVLRTFSTEDKLP